MIRLIIPIFLLPCWMNFQDYGKRDTDFTIVLDEHDSFPPGVEARLTTTRECPCTGYRIQAGLSWRSDTLTLSLGGLVRPSPCYAIPDVAIGRLHLGDIGDGTYVIRVKYRNEEDLHRLIISNRRASVVPLAATFTRVVWE
jgi:hypothetical protein